MARRRIGRILLLAAAAALVATQCDSSNPSISDDDYDRSCVDNGDCTVVWTGDVCSCDRVGAIRSSAADSFSDSRSTKREDCSTTISCGDPTDRWRAVCVAGTCTVDEQVPDAVGGPDADVGDTAEDADIESGADGDIAEDADIVPGLDADGGSGDADVETDVTDGGPSDTSDAGDSPSDTDPGDTVSDDTDSEIGDTSDAEPTDTTASDGSGSADGGGDTASGSDDADSSS